MQIKFEENKPITLAFVDKKEKLTINGFTETISPPVYDGEYIIPPEFEDTVLSTKDKLVKNDIVVNKINVIRTPNTEGYTVYIG